MLDSLYTSLIILESMFYLIKVALYRQAVLLNLIVQELGFSETYWEECVDAVKRET